MDNKKGRSWMISGSACSAALAAALPLPG